MQDVNNQRFYRSNNRILGGVCAGLAEGFHVDPLWVRIAFLLLVLLQGAGLFVYVVLWLVMPERFEGGGQRNGFDAMTADLRRIWSDVQQALGSNSRRASSPATPPASASAPNSHPASQPSPSPPSPVAAPPGPQSHGVWQNQSVVVGVILVVIGLAVLGGNIGIIEWSLVWPAALITVGIVILIRNLERRT